VAQASFERARDHVYRSGRVLERRLFARLFEDGDVHGVVSAVLAYANADGGFGHGLEPDKLAPQSQPLDIQFALQSLAEAGAEASGRVAESARATCDFLEPLADDRGLVPIVLPSVAEYPRAEHWGDGNFPPGINPTIAIAGYLNGFGVEHPWLTRATETCLETLEKETLDEAHAFVAAAVFVEHVPDARPFAARLAETLPNAQWFLADPDAEGYGVLPTKLPREWFDDALYDAHLDKLESQQEEDGGWPVAWNPPGPGSLAAWRAILTIEALKTLKKNGRLN
jgi:hypothetical protein